MISRVLTFASGILDLGSAPNAFGQTLALLITFLGIGVIANVLIVYAVAQVLAERKENEERVEAFHQSHNRT
jgi:hypothetical protein